MQHSTGWCHFSHQADIGIHAEGDSLESAFVQAALGLTAVITEPERVAASESVTIHCAAPDFELLLVDWLNALIFEMATRHMLFSRFEVRIAEGELEATAWGEGVEPLRHQPAVEVKGATYTALTVRQLPDGRWQIECVVDV